MQANASTEWRHAKSCSHDYCEENRSGEFRVFSNRRHEGRHCLGGLFLDYAPWCASLLVVLGMWGFSPLAIAGNVPDEYTQFLRARSEVGPLNADDMFGDRIGLFTGSLEFLQTDVSIPGNNNLEVGIKRKLRAGSQGVTGLFADWDLAIPSVHGVYSEQGGWNNYTTEPQKRCSKYVPPSDETVQVPWGSGYAKKFFAASEFFLGVFLYLPESGDEDVLTAGSWPKPSNGYDYVLRTKSGAAIRCILTEDGAGEAFEVLTPEGITYRLDHMASRPVAPIIKTDTVMLNGWPQTLEFVLMRREYFLLPTIARDRFGNTVTYTWSSTDPWQLTRISSSDGRVLDITTVKASSGLNRITQVTHGTRAWTYEYPSGGLTKVTLPDQTSWEFAPGLTTNTIGSGSIPADNSYCFNPGLASSSRSGFMKHPSGARAIFSLTPTLHGRSWSIYSCDTTYGASSFFEQSSENYPAKYYMWSLTTKQISGPGIQAPLVWTYVYGPDNGCYSDTDLGNIRCQASSPTTKWVDVTDPSGVTARHTFGNKFSVDEGLLLGVSKLGQNISQSYELSGSGPYPAAAGLSIASPKGLGFFVNRMIPLREKTIEQDGMKFTWRANSYDAWARPTNVTESSAPSP